MLITNILVSSIILGLLIWMAIKAVLIVITHVKFMRKFMIIPHRRSHPIFGNVLEYPGPGEAGMAYQRERVSLNPRLDVIWILQTPAIMVNHPETLKLVLKTTEPKGKDTYNLLTPWIGDGLLKSSGNKWARNRRLLTPAFHFEILKTYLALKNEAADILIDKFARSAKSKSSLEVVTNISLLTLDVILRSSMSYETKCQELGERHPYVKAVNEITDLIRDRFFKPWFRLDLIYFLTPNARKFKRHCKYVHDVADEIILKRIEELKNGGVCSNTVSVDKKKKYEDFLDILIKARDSDGNGLTHKEIRDEVDTFLFEGYETTTSAISWTIYSIAKDPSIQARVHQEIDERFSQRSTDEILWEDLGELPYLTRVMKEAMRHYSTIPFIQRELTKDLQIDEFIIPAKTMVNIVIYNIHHNPQVWEDPMKFDPDRFLPENIQKRDPFAYIPFSAGPRNCIGQNFAMDEMKVCLAKIFKRFSIRLDPDHVVSQSQSLVMKADNDIKIFVTDRFSSM